jgi:hypothetical protein
MMATVQEIGRVPDGIYDLAAEVLVEPPLDFDKNCFSRGIGQVVFREAADSYNYVRCSQTARLEGVAQTMRVEVHSEYPAATVNKCNEAVEAVRTYVTALAAGDTETLQAFLPGAEDPSDFPFKH